VVAVNIYLDRNALQRTIYLLAPVHLAAGFSIAAMGELYCHVWLGSSQILVMDVSMLSLIVLC